MSSQEIISFSDTQNVFTDVHTWNDLVMQQENIRHLLKSWTVLSPVGDVQKSRGSDQL